MKNDFITLYTHIEPKEQEDFANYIHCFYGSQKAVVELFEEINTVFSSESALETIRKVSVNDKNRLNALSDLKKWLFEFFALQEARQNNLEAKFLSLEALRKRGFYTAFEQKSKQMKADLEKQNYPNLWQLFWKVRLSHTHYFNLPLDRLLDYQDDMHQLQHELDNFYIAAKLKYGAELYSRSNIRQEKYEELFLDNVLDLSEKEITPSVKNLYLPLVELTKNKSETAYTTLKQFLRENPKHDAFDRQCILLYLINFTTSRIGKGEDVILNEWFDLYKLGLQQSLFTVSGYFSITTYLNIVNVACRLMEYDWLRQFIKTWSPYLPTREQDGIKNFALARLAFEEKHFDRVITLTQSVPFKNFIVTLNIRLLNIRALYELNTSLNVLIDQCNALYLYAFRNKQIGDSWKERVINFTKIFRKLINKKSKNSLLKELENPKNVAICHDWLKEKIDALP